MNVERVMWGIVALSIALAILALVAIYWSMPSSHRAVTPPPLDRDGYVYTCYCYRDPVRVQIQDPRSPRRTEARRRHARGIPWLIRHRVRPDSHVSHAGAGGGGGTAPVLVAA
ncbi:hypothetical protein OG453_38145 [Streptomyces sp. NBC_01381]|uniref:hypothetical protein n=1 Tax=Streptomyces sp. NBC_01381 TaxID=2903845 RepID=UPI00224CF1B7|nr:hypothetical protein [Streptomyces sp. NBC_01381]MCX4672413.1 hypothetical protein [Streptomyces sp. NBC_01381]